MKVKLGDVATYINGYAFKPSDWSNTGMPIIRIQDLTGNSYQMNRYNGKCDSKYEVYDGDVLISWSASLGVYVWQGEDAVLNQHIFKVVFDKVQINKSFFAHQVRAILETASSEAHGATMKHLTKPVFDALPFILPPIEEQERMSFILDSVCSIIEQRRKQLQKLDELVKARFVEMFGEPISNSCSHPMIALSELGNWNSGGTPSRANPAFFEGDIDWYSAGELNTLYLNGSIEKITEEALKSSAAKLFATGSMLVGMYDTAAFKMGILKKASASNQACACIEPNDNVNIVWLYYCLQLMKPHFLEQRRGIRQKNLNLGMIRGFKIPCANYEQQCAFSTFVSEVDKSELSIHASLDQLETLKHSLMQKYFGQVSKI